MVILAKSVVPSICFHKDANQNNSDSKDLTDEDRDFQQRPLWYSRHAGKSKLLGIHA